MSACEARHRGLIYRTWTCYGVPGLGLLAPLVIGAPLVRRWGYSARRPAGRLAFWLTLGIVLWSAGLTFVAALGLGPLLAFTGAGTAS